MRIVALSCSESVSEPIHVQALIDRPCRHFVLMPTRRGGLGRLMRVVNAFRLADSLPEACVVLVDSNPDSNLPELITGMKPTSPVVYLRSTVPASQLHPQYRLRFPNSSSMQTLHDDDWWDWGDSFSVALTESEPTLRLVSTPNRPLDSKWISRKLRKGFRDLHLNYYFGILPAEMWNAFAEYASRFDHPSDSLDIALVAGLQVAPSLVPEPRFVYEYDDARWLDSEWARDADTRIARQCGWGAYSGPSATAFMSCCDSLALTASFAHLSSPQFVYAATNRILKRFPPVLGNLPQTVKRSLPRGLRAAVSDTNGRLGKAHRVKNIGMALRGMASNQNRFESDPISSLLRGEKLITTVSEAIESLDTLDEFLPTLSERTAVWRPLIQSLE